MKTDTTDYAALDIALSAVRRGWKVFPAGLTEYGKKTPMVKGWQEKATTETTQIRAWFEQGDLGQGRRAKNLLVWP